MGYGIVCRIGVEESQGATIARLSVAVLKSTNFFGLGEVSGAPRKNNRGPAIDYWRRNDGTGKGPGGAGSWCAVAPSAAQQIAATELGLKVPWEASRGAKRFARNMAKAGSWAAVPSRVYGLAPNWRYDEGDVPIGSLIAWHRGPPGRRDLRWQGHVETWIEYDPKSDTLTTISANVNNRVDAAGRRFAVIDYRRQKNGAWRRRLYGVASPV